MRANAELVAFDILRDRDEITLVFGVQRGSARADFRLLGDKPAYYRMAMGVRLDDTLTALAKADPGIESAGVDKIGKALKLRLRYAWPPGTGEEVEVAHPAPGAPPPERRSAPPAAPAREKEARAAYRNARREGTVEALTRFLQTYPEAPQAEEARQRIEGMREEEAYRKVLARDEPAEYRAFLERHPGSSHRAEIEKRMKAAEEKRRAQAAEEKRRAQAAEEKRRAQAADEKRRAQAADEKRRAQAAYGEARKVDTAAAYRVFLAAYPNAPQAKEAQQSLKNIETDDEAFREASGSEKGLEAYLKARPKGRHSDQALKLLTSMKSARMEEDFQRAKAQGTAEAFQGFLDAWPGSPRVGEARAAIEVLQRPTPNRPSAPETWDGVEKALLAVRVESGPTVDGRPDDDVWATAPPLEVPVKGPSGIESVRARAVHDGNLLYLLVEWADPTRDALYRPWIWDSANKTYHQDGQVDDALAVALYRTTDPHGSCMLSGEEYEADTWVWRAYWSEVSGLADDGLIRVSAERIPQSNPYPSRSGAGQVWIREESDGGSPGWTFFIPVEFQGAVVPSYRPSQVRGSRGDVNAQGAWSSGNPQGLWTVEMARALDTTHSDDVALGEGRSQAIAFAVYDKSEKGGHSTSPIVRLEVQAR